MKSNLPKQMRPRKFKDVIGQDLPVKLIHSGLKKDLLGNVCLLHGPAGVGKTTLARLIAQWICCENHIECEPCGECKNCQNCINGIHPDVFELDGASNTSVESIRNLLDGSVYKPVIAKKRIYIIDEVHMLSKSAISALLKTLEEPNEYIQFILATTDIEKIPNTIISRCFKVSLDSIKEENIISHLKNLSQKHNICISDSALQMISIASYGSMRQAISILEQASLLFDNKIDEINLANMLGLISSENLDEILNYIKNKEIAKLQKITELIVSQGGNALNIIKQILIKIRKSADFSTQNIALGYMLAQSSVELHQSPYPEEILDIHLLKAAMMYNLSPSNHNDHNNEIENLEINDINKNSEIKVDLIENGTSIDNELKNKNTETYQSNIEKDSKNNIKNESIEKSKKTSNKTENLREMAYDLFKQ